MIILHSGSSQGSYRLYRDGRALCGPGARRARRVAARGSAHAPVSRRRTAAPCIAACLRVVVVAFLVRGCQHPCSSQGPRPAHATATDNMYHTRAASLVYTHTHLGLVTTVAATPAPTRSITLLPSHAAASALQFSPPPRTHIDTLHLVACCHIRDDIFDQCVACMVV